MVKTIVDYRLMRGRAGVVITLEGSGVPPFQEEDFLPEIKHIEFLNEKNRLDRTSQITSGIETIKEVTIVFHPRKYTGAPHESITGAPDGELFVLMPEEKCVHFVRTFEGKQLYGKVKNGEPIEETDKVPTLFGSFFLFFMNMYMSEKRIIVH